MATRFEIVLHGDNPVALRAAGEEALDEIERLEARLSLFRREQRNRSPQRPRGPRAGAGDAGLVRPVAARAAASRGKRRGVRHYDCAAGALLGVYGGKRPFAASRGAGGGTRLCRHVAVHLDPADFTVRFARRA